MRKSIVIFLTAASLALAGCSQKSSVEKSSQRFNSLPPAVQRTVRAQAPDAEIASIKKQTRDNMTYYVVEFREPGTNPKITVAQNGALVTGDAEKVMGGTGRDSDTQTGRGTKEREMAPKGTTGRAAKIDLSALPVPVQKTLKAEVPNAIVADISRHDRDGRTIYEFKFQDEGKNPSMWISEDGTVVQSLKK
jgi:hypothetical protein